MGSFAIRQVAEEFEIKLKKSMARKPIQDTVQASVLVKSRRRCCICYGLHRDIRMKQGQIAHLDKNSENPAEDNLAFLCFHHHDAFDSTTRQSKNLTRKEVEIYRDELHDHIATMFELPTSVLGVYLQFLRLRRSLGRWT